MRVPNLLVQHLVSQGRGRSRASVYACLRELSMSRSPSPSKSYEVPSRHTPKTHSGLGRRDLESPQVPFTAKPHSEAQQVGNRVRDSWCWDSLYISRED